MSERQIGPDGWDGWPDWAREIAEASPEAAEVRQKTWAEMLPPPQKSTAQMRSYIAWMRITHHGGRSPSSPTCNECQTPMTDEEIAEYEAALGRPPAPDRWI
jgi:hypothetical protein